jgi:hypothetical protein
MLLHVLQISFFKIFNVQKTLKKYSFHFFALQSLLWIPQRNEKSFFKKFRRFQTSKKISKNFQKKIQKGSEKLIFQNFLLPERKTFKMIFSFFFTFLLSDSEFCSPK